MFKYIVYLFAYVALFILWACLIISVLKIFNMVEIEGKLLLPIIFSGVFYHKYKPMNFLDLVKLAVDRIKG